MAYASPMQCAALTCLALACACGAGQPPPPVAHASGTNDPHFVEREPPSYTPRSGEQTRADSGLGLELNAPHDEALGVAQSMLRALVDGDEPSLQRLFAEQILYTQSASLIPRNEVLERCLQEARSLAYGALGKSAALAELHTLSVRPALLVHAPGPLPAGIRGDDLVVQLTPPRNHAEAIRRIPCIADVYVRPGAHAQIVGLMR